MTLLVCGVGVTREDVFHTQVLKVVALGNSLMLCKVRRRIHECIKGPSFIRTLVCGKNYSGPPMSSGWSNDSAILSVSWHGRCPCIFCGIGD